MNPTEKHRRTTRRPLGLWLAGITAGTLVATCIAPFTGPVARDQIKALIGGGSAAIVTRSLDDIGISGYTRDRSNDDRTGLLAQHPDDFQLHLAGAIERGQAMRRQANQNPGGKPYSIGTDIRALTPQFPNQPGLYATAMRLDTMGIVRMARPESALASQEHLESPNTWRDDRPDPGDIRGFIEDAEQGEKLEPDNAYFPFMKTIGLFALRQDNEALESLAHAARLSGWNEHIGDEVEGKWRLLVEGRSAIPRSAIAAGILFPHYARLRDAARLATVKAMRLEQAGRPREAAEIRTNLMRVGDLMRSKATSLIGNLVGIAIVHTAVSRPGGAPPLKNTGEVGRGFTAHERDDLSRRRFAALRQYWQIHGLAERVPLAEERFNAGLETRNRTQRMVEFSPFNGPTLGSLILLWSAGSFILTNAWWLLIAGGLASLAVARRRNSGSERMPKSGPLVLFVAGALLLALCVKVAISQVGFIAGMTRMFAALSGLMEGGSAEASDNGLFIAIATAAVPILLGAMTLIVSLVRRVPLRLGLAQGFARVGLPLACLLIFVFCGLCVATARQEERVNVALEGTLQHEGRYLSRLTGQGWPDPIE